MPLMLSPHLYDAIWAQAAHYQVDYYLITAIISAESSFDPTAIGDSGHSYGLMQLHDRGAGHGYPASELLQLDRNLEIGVAYLRQCINAYPGELPRAVLAYNRGIAGARNFGDPEEDTYVAKVLDLAKEYRRIGIQRQTLQGWML